MFILLLLHMFTYICNICYYVVEVYEDIEFGSQNVKQTLERRGCGVQAERNYNGRALFRYGNRSARSGQRHLLISIFLNLM